MKEVKGSGFQVPKHLCPLISSLALPTGSVPVWLLLLLCVGLIIVTILLLQTAFPGFL
jgi:hypothetical protein